MQNEPQGATAGSHPAAKLTETRLFPEDSWFHPRLHPVLLHGMKKIYQAFGIDPKYLFTCFITARLRHDADWRRSDALEAILTSLIQAAVDRIREQEEEGHSISVDNPLLAAYSSQNSDKTKGVSKRLVGEMRDNPVFMSSQTKRSLPRSLAPTLEAPASGGGEQHLQNLKAEVSSANAGNQDLLAARQAAMDRHRHRQTSHVDGENPPASVHGDVAPDGDQMPEEQAHPPHGGTPARKAHVSGQADDACRSSPPTPDFKRYNEMERARAGQRKEVQVKSIMFTPGDIFLEDFITHTSALLAKQIFLPDEDKASLVVAMLAKPVLDKVKGDSRIVHPSSPQQIYDLLRTAYPQNQAQLVVELQGMHQRPGQAATEFLDLLKTVYILNGVRLPSQHSEMLNLYMKFNSRFASHVRAYDSKVDFARQQKGQTHGDYVFTWEELTKLGTTFDMDQKLKSTSRELSQLGPKVLVPGKIRAQSASAVAAGKSSDNDKFSSARKTPFDKGKLAAGPMRDPEKLARIAQQSEASATEQDQHDEEHEMETHREIASDSENDSGS